MSNNRVRKGCKYRYVPVLIDRLDYDLPSGTIVTVGPVPGMRAKTVNCGQVHVYNDAGQHLAFVHVNSLQKIEKASKVEALVSFLENADTEENETLARL
jgi:hypothetical protein